MRVDGMTLWVKGAMPLLLMGALTACGSGDSLENFGGPTMGSTYSIKYVRTPGGPSVAQVKPEVEAILARGRPANVDVSQRFGHRALQRTARPTAVSQCLRRSCSWCAYGEQLSVDSQGSYDLTVEPLLEPLGFWPAGASRTRTEPEGS